MAIGTYAQLKTAIETWLARSGDTIISGSASDYVTLAESRLNRDLPLNINRTDTNLTGTSGSRSIALPSDYYTPIALFLTTYGIRTWLRPMIAGNVALGTFAAPPDAWCINGTNIDLDVPCDQAHTFVFRYRKSFALSDSATTNWLLTNHPDVYLFAALVEAAGMTGDMETAAFYEARLTKAMEEVLDKDARQLALAPLTMDHGMMSEPGFNIYSG